MFGNRLNSSGLSEAGATLADTDSDPTETSCSESPQKTLDTEPKISDF